MKLKNKTMQKFIEGQDQFSDKSSVKSTLVHVKVCKSDLKKIFHHYYTNKELSMMKYIVGSLDLNKKSSNRSLKKYKKWFNTYDEIFKKEKLKSSLVLPKSLAELYLLDTIIKMDLDKLTIFMEQIKFDKTRIGPLAFDNDTSIKNWGQCQQLAVRQNNVLLVRILVSYGLFPLPQDCPKQEPLLEAIDFHNYEMLEALLDLQFEPDSSMFYCVFKSQEVKPGLKINILHKMLKSEMSIDECKDIVLDVISLRSEVLLSALIDCIDKKRYKEIPFEFPNFQEILDRFDFTLFTRLVDVLKYPPVSIDLVNNIINKHNDNKNNKKRNGVFDCKTYQIIQKLTNISLDNHLTHNNVAPLVFSTTQKNLVVGSVKNERESSNRNSISKINHCSDESSSYCSCDHLSSSDDESISSSSMTSTFSSLSSSSSLSSKISKPLAISGPRYRRIKSKAI